MIDNCIVVEVRAKMIIIIIIINYNHRQADDEFLVSSCLFSY